MMKNRALTIVTLALLLAGCGNAEPAAEDNSAPADATTSAAPVTEEATEEPTSSTEEDVKEALSAPTEAPDVDPAGDPEQQFLQAYKSELETLPEGPHAQLGTDEEAIALGYQACDDLTQMSHSEALFTYAFSDATEEQVADYNAALNAAQFTPCP